MVWADALRKRMCASILGWNLSAMKPDLASHVVSQFRRSAQPLLTPPHPGRFELKYFKYQPHKPWLQQFRISTHIAPSRIAMGSSEPSTQSFVSAQTYPYSPLKDCEIRVLDLLPGQQSDPIECALHIVNVNKYTDYTAISYVWGTEPWSRMIRVDDTNMSVSPNLEAALLQVRLPSNSIP